MRQDIETQKRIEIEERLLKEAATLEEFWSVYFPKIYDIRRKSDDNSLYIISQYFPGCTLKEILETKNSKVLTQEFYSNFKEDIQFALDYLHIKKGILHLDLTPDNIIIDLDHRAHIIDFDNSKKANTYLKAEDIRGKEKYLAPELKRNQGINLTPYLDHYSFQKILKEIYHSLSFKEKIKEKLNRKSKKLHLSSTAKLASLAILFLLTFFTFTINFNQDQQLKSTVRTPAIIEDKTEALPIQVKQTVSTSLAAPTPRETIQIKKNKKKRVKKVTKTKTPPRNKKKKLTFKESFLKLINTQDEDFKECISFSPKREEPITIDFEIEGKTGYLSTVTIKEAKSLSNLTRVCLDTLYKKLQYPEHKSGQNIIITQKFWLPKGKK